MRFNKTLTVLATSAALATLASTAAFANQAGDIIVRAGITQVAPDSNDSTIYAGGATVHLGGPALTAAVEDDEQLGLNLVYFFTDQVAIELLAATPFSHDLTVDTGAGVAPLGSTKQLPPTLSVLYYPNEPSSKWQPYLGLGVNYTVFFEEEFDSGMTGTGSPLDLSNLKLKNSWGLSAQVGLDYQLDDNWLVNASVRYIDIDTEGTFDVGSNGSGTVDVDIDPWVYTLALGYRF